MFTRVSHSKNQRGGQFVSWAPPRAAVRNRSVRQALHQELPDAEGHNLDHKPNPHVTPVVHAALERLGACNETMLRTDVALPNYAMEAFASLLIGEDAHAAEDFLRRLTPHDLSIEGLSDHVLRDALSRLGNRWSDDKISIADMSIAVSRVHGLSRSFASSRSLCETAISKGRAMFATLMHQTHTLGVGLAAEAFRNSNWDVDLCLNQAPDMIVRVVKSTRPNVIGLTVGTRRDIPGVHKTVLKLRALPFRCKVLVGGNAVGLLEERSNKFLVDAFVPDIATALVRAGD